MRNEKFLNFVKSGVLAWALSIPLVNAQDYKIVATIGMIADVAREVAGPLAEVQGLIGEAVDPHLYKPTRNDVVKLQQADIVFYNGLMLEGKMNDILVRLAQSGKQVVPVTQRVVELPGYVMDSESSHYDPHVWMDVGGWVLATEVVKDTLAKFDSANAKQYERNARRYVKLLQSLDDYAKYVLGSIPKSQRVLITAHDAFNYFGRAYGIEVRGIQGISTESEAGVRDIEELIKFIIERQVKAVFVETSVADKNVRALVEGARAQGHQLEIGGSLYSDAMGKLGTYEGTYVGMLDHNITTVAKALGAKGLSNGGFQAYLSDKRDSSEASPMSNLNKYGG